MSKFQTPAPVTVVLDIPAGRVEVIAADRSDTVVEVRPADPSKGKDAKAAEQIAVEYTDGVVRITAPEPKDKLFGSSGSVEVTVQAPTGSHLEAVSAAAEFRGVGRLGEVSVRGGHRTVKFDETAGARITAHDGTVEVGRLGGSAEIGVQRGDITVAEAQAGSLTLTAQQGDITVAAAPGVSASLDASTTLGRVHNTLKNDGAPALEIHATTQQGDISARSL
ncbi:DUF4097 family beta strand repeat-containing protein [Streptomyces sp. NPDC060194]|uniref:DUF4097 family beta strand repeat-containing protein n=1 Tax=Streptomyces sp. NPDC060194 TaxID=3347069 RepID=UPI00365D9176